MLYFREQGRKGKEKEAVGKKRKKGVWREDRGKEREVKFPHATSSILV